MSRIPDHIIERINNAMPIAELVGRYVKLNGHPPRQKGLCPFHADKNPSLTVGGRGKYANSWKCWSAGCNQGGSAIQFIMLIETCDFMTAVRRTAQIAGVTYLLVPHLNDRQRSHP